MDPDDLPHDTAPDIVIADEGPLRLLAGIDMLHLLHAYGDTVLLVDVVADAAVGTGTTDAERRIAAWLEAGRQPDAIAVVRVATTEIGRATGMARLVDPTSGNPQADRVAIREWLVATLREKGWPMLVVAQDMLAGNLALDELTDGNVTLSSTRSFLYFAERKGLIPSAAKLWAMISTDGARTDPGDHDEDDQGEEHPR
ncbi:MAG: hypothetical protein ACRYG8_44435 [Janthinobacterium lividum]